MKNILFFGPVSVHPLYQHKGYGEKLINFTMNKAKELGYNEILIIGNPNYYSKYVFVSASKYHIHYECMEKNDEATFFTIKVLNDELKVLVEFIAIRILCKYKKRKARRI